MSETATTTATSEFKATTAKQRQLIADLSEELGREIEVPRSAKIASAVIAGAIREAAEAAGEKPAPTRRQLRLLARLGEERGKTYRVPATRKAASARIKQILAAGAPGTAEAAA
jgi:hypothetical protein